MAPGRSRLAQGRRPSPGGEVAPRQPGTASTGRPSRRPRLPRRPPRSACRYRCGAGNAFPHEPQRSIVRRTRSAACPNSSARASSGAREKPNASSISPPLSLRAYRLPLGLSREEKVPQSSKPRDAAGAWRRPCRVALSDNWALDGNTTKPFSPTTRCLDRTTAKPSGPASERSPIPTMPCPRTDRDRPATCRRPCPRGSPLHILSRQHGKRHWPPPKGRRMNMPLHFSSAFQSGKRNRSPK